MVELERLGEKTVRFVAVRANGGMLFNVWFGYVQQPFPLKRAKICTLSDRQPVATHSRGNADKYVARASIGVAAAAPMERLAWHSEAAVFMVPLK